MNTPINLLVKVGLLVSLNCSLRCENCTLQFLENLVLPINKTMKLMFLPNGRPVNLAPLAVPLFYPTFRITNLLTEIFKT